MYSAALTVVGCYVPFTANRPVVAAHGYRSVLLIAKRINFFAAAQVRE
jgi:hypothetical protein